MKERSDKVSVMHGGGGEAMHGLLRDLLKNISQKEVKGGTGLKELDDAAVIPFRGKKLVFTTDSYVVEPLFFPGGDIGKLSICGTINDLAAMGARPLAVSAAYVISAGMDVADLERITKSMDRVSRETRTPIVTGDTKVVEKGLGLVVNTSGIGVAEKVVADSGLKPGDKILINGMVGDHGMALMSFREGIGFESKLKSDCAPLSGMIQEVMRYRIHAMKDPTRGGIASALNEMARKSKADILIHEPAIPIRKEVSAASEMLGIDPYTVANEGKMLIGAAKEDAEAVLRALRKNRYGRNAAIIGEVQRKGGGRVVLETLVGGERLLEAPIGDPIPRVC